MRYRATASPRRTPLRRLLLAALGATAAAACHRAPAAPPQAPEIAASLYHDPPFAADKLWFPDLVGASPTDTSVQFAPDSGRTIVMRHSLPDGAIFAIVRFPPGTVIPQSGATAQVTLHPVPGRIGLEILTPDSIGPGAAATFSYAIHFQAPSDAVAHFGTPGRFEQALAAARSLGDGRLQFLPTERPAADMIRFPIDRPGTYLVATPR